MKDIVVRGAEILERKLKERGLTIVDADEITALRKRVEVLEGALHKIHRTANGNRKDKAFRVAQIATEALQDKPNG